MSSMPVFRRRIRSIRSTKQITKAMELVSAAKMRRSSEAALASRTYSDLALHMLGSLMKDGLAERHVLYRRREVRNRLYIVISANRGLSGAYNKNILHFFGERLAQDRKDAITSKALLIGKKAGRFASRINGLDVIGLYDRLPENASVAELAPLLSTAISSFTAEACDEVVLLYTAFTSYQIHALTAEVLLPAGVFKQAAEAPAMTVEPDIETVLGVATKRLIEVRVLQAFLESQACEQSERMFAMKTATDNATDLLDDLDFTLNSMRQTAITRELAEIAAGGMA